MKTTQTLGPGQGTVTVNSSPNSQKTNKPPSSQDQAGNDNSGKTNTAAIVAPIVVILFIGISVGVGFVLYRQRKNRGNLERLTSDGATQSSMLHRLINRIQGKGGDEGIVMGEVENPGQEIHGISNPTCDTA